MSKVHMLKITAHMDKDILPFLDEVAELRIKIFREWPYLYDGDIKTENNYLKAFADTKDSLLVLAKEYEKIVGVVMGLPVAESMKQIQEEYQRQNVSTDGIFYLADAIILAPYRGQGIGTRMLQIFENLVVEMQKYDQISFCEIVRDQNHPLKPKDYQSLDAFWEQLDFYPIPGWQTSFDYLDIGNSEETPHLMRFRRKIILQ
ncbi:MAG: GNAT family N-acetyltransferase [Simkaniaceae bacterium]|nr:GNAT family N-acetyltransferase [Candidatus Sacchlamyda saccharinae]